MWGDTCQLAFSADVCGPEIWREQLFVAVAEIVAELGLLLIFPWKNCKGRPMPIRTESNGAWNGVKIWEEMGGQYEPN